MDVGGGRLARTLGETPLDDLLEARQVFWLVFSVREYRDYTITTLACDMVAVTDEEESCINHNQYGGGRADC